MINENGLLISIFSYWSDVCWIWTWNLTKQCLSLLSRLWALKFCIIVLLDIQNLFHDIRWGGGHLFLSWLLLIVMIPCSNLINEVQNWHYNKNKNKSHYWISTGEVCFLHGKFVINRNIIYESVTFYTNYNYCSILTLKWHCSSTVVCKHYLFFFLLGNQFSELRCVHRLWVWLFSKMPFFVR